MLESGCVQWPGVDSCALTVAIDGRPAFYCSRSGPVPSHCPCLSFMDGTVARNIGRRSSQNNASAGTTIPFIRQKSTHQETNSQTQRKAPGSSTMRKPFNRVQRQYSTDDEYIHTHA